MRKTHGYLKHPLYTKYVGMMSRCYNKKEDGYKNYGGRGIYVCNEWKGYPLRFVMWGFVNGWELGLEIDRIDNDGPYAPGNCRFVTKTENIRNCRATKLKSKDIEAIKNRLDKGETDTSIAKIFNVHQTTISRIKRGASWN